jgi:hypothetical protein
MVSAFLVQNAQARWWDPALSLIAIASWALGMVLSADCLKIK